MDKILLQKEYDRLLKVLAIEKNCKNRLCPHKCRRKKIFLKAFLMFAFDGYLNFAETDEDFISDDDFVALIDSL